MAPDAQATLTEANDDGPAPSFEELLEAYDFDSPRTGDILTGIVLQVTDEEIILDVGTKHDAFVPRRDLDRVDNDVLEGLEPGTELKVYVLKPRGANGELLVSISKALTARDWERAAQLEAGNDTIEVRVNGFNKGGALVDFGRLRGFVPNSQLVAVPRGASTEEQEAIKSDLIGQTIPVKVIEANPRRNRLVLSEVAARRDQRQAILEKLQVGQVVQGQVVKLVDYGAFVDIGGVNGLIHISKLDWQHVNHPSDVLSVGEQIEVRIEDVDTERERISLNRQALLPDPWDNLTAACEVGDLVTGKVSSLADYGVFVELPFGVTGLVHVSEMSSYNISNPKEWANEGDDLLVRIISIDTHRKRVGLSLDQVSQDELYDWMMARGQQPPDDEPQDIAPVGAEVAEAETHLES